MIFMLTDDINQVQDIQYGSEVQFIEHCQYFRRENVEIHNVPESIEQKNLEKHVLVALASINIQLQFYDIVAIHRVGKKISRNNRKVLVRFVNRKNAFRCLNNRKLRLSGNRPFRKYISQFCDCAHV